jgi:hypothetical protein
MITPKQKFDKLWMLKEEIEYAESQLRPHDTGHISTAIGWMNSRLRTLKGELENELDEVSTE